jgi:menaquinone-dependent protoporphyrinogen oxidase
MDTNTRVLVAHATVGGSTEEIARRIAAVLEAAGHHVLCCPAHGDLDANGFDAIVIGSAVHDMAWLAAATALIRRHPTIGDRPLWCFSVVGLPDPERTPLHRWMARSERRRIERSFPPSCRPLDHRLFSGIIDWADLPPRGRLFFRAVGGRSGDHRDWAAIDAWARDIAAYLSTRPAKAEDSQR